MVVIDSSQETVYQLDMTTDERRISRFQAVAGNVVTSSQVRYLIEAGADVRVGMGVGSTCTTQEVVLVVGLRQGSISYF